MRLTNYGSVCLWREYRASQKALATHSMCVGHAHSVTKMLMYLMTGSVSTYFDHCHITEYTVQFSSIVGH